jgi:hypothetical protein
MVMIQRLMVMLRERKTVSDTVFGGGAVVCLGAGLLAFAAAAAMGVGAVANEMDAVDAVDQRPADMLPHVRIDRENRVVELDATVVLRESEWIELIACSPGSKEHESILVVPARPSHVHLALLILGLEPGAPMRFEHHPPDQNPPDAQGPDEGGRDGPVIQPPHGPAVRITAALADEPEHEFPVTQWTLDRRTGRPVADEPWLFTGSRMVTIHERERYLADLHGTTIALVNFGDEVLARPTDLTNFTDDGSLVANTDAIPPLGTAVLLRLRPVDPAPDAQPASP